MSEKFRNWVYFLTCILPDYMAHDIPKEFWKNIHFEKMTAGFLVRCQNLLRQCPPKMMHFQAWKYMILTNNALKAGFCPSGFINFALLKNMCTYQVISNITYWAVNFPKIGAKSSKPFGNFFCRVGNFFCRLAVLFSCHLRIQ